MGVPDRTFARPAGSAENPLNGLARSNAGYHALMTHGFLLALIPFAVTGLVSAAVGPLGQAPAPGQLRRPPPPLAEASARRGTESKMWWCHRRA